MSSEQDRIRVVAVGAHPDDCEIGVGGTLARLSASGISCGIIDLTNAEPTPANDLYRSPDDYDKDYDKKRKEEASHSASILGLKDRVILNLPNRKLFDTFENRCALALQFRRWKPDVVLCMFGRTVLASPDHYQAQLLTEAAFFYTRLTKWEQYFEGEPVWNIRSLLYFPITADIFHPEDGASGRLTSFIMDVSDSIHLKREAILAYRSQFQDQKKEKFVEGVLDRNRYFGRMAGTDYGEHLCSVKPFLIKDFNFWL